MKEIDALIKQYALPHTIYITQPTMPDFERYSSMLKRIWETKWVSNYGEFHRELEQRLLHFLGVQYCSLFCNGTLALLSAMKALNLKGEVITTPFSFPATANVLKWLNLKPVFCDIEEKTFTINPENIKRLINKKTSAILPVHVYGYPCDVNAIQNIADTHGLKIIYDAAHAFGVRLNGTALVQYGDASMLSFHATKLFTTLEGGALI